MKIEKHDCVEWQAYKNKLGIGKMFGLKDSQMSRIARNQSWRHV